MAATREQTRRFEGTAPARDIYDIVGYDGAGVPVRLIDRAMEVYRLGHGDRDAAARCGVHVDTIRSWIREGTGIAADLQAGRVKWADLTRQQRKVHTFAQQTVVAETEGKLYLRSLAEQLARGGLVTKKETVKVDKDGNILEQSVTETTTLPDPTMIRWLLARRFRDEYGDRISVEASGPDGGPLQVEVGTVLDRLLGDLDAIAAADDETSTLLAHAQEVAELPPAPLEAEEDSVGG